MTSHIAEGGRAGGTAEDRRKSRVCLVEQLKEKLKENKGKNRGQKLETGNAGSQTAVVFRQGDWLHTRTPARSRGGKARTGEGVAGEEAAQASVVEEET